MNNANAWKTAKRLMGYVAGTLRLQFMVVYCNFSQRGCGDGGPFVFAISD